ncbi:MAG: efflux RND transporter periplasmic adaptor subunit [Desulfuromonadales bacterium]
MNRKKPLFRHLPVRLTLGFAALAALTLTACNKEEVKATPRPVEVPAVKVEPQTVPVTASFVAQVESSHQVEIMARVSGFLEKILYKEGEMVNAGQVMFQIDTKPFQAQVAAAKGEVENRQAQLWTARANLNRVQPLADLDAASKSDLDNAIGAVQSAEAALYSAKANLDKAELDLGYTTIHAPVSGVSGEALLREGAFLSAGPESRLSYVAKLDPIWVTFSVSQNQMAQRSQEIASGLLIPPADQNYDIEIELSDGSRYPYTGKVNFVSSLFSQQTGTFLIRAELVNPDKVLRPGMFVKAAIKGATRPNALVVPQKAVQQTANGHVVYLVSPQGTTEVRPVIVGEWVGNDWVINKGLKAGEQVIIEGFQRLKPDAPVKIVAAPVSAAPAAAPAGKQE